MDDLYKWNEKYAVEDPTIDAQHKYLFKLANDVQNASSEEIKQYILKLFKYANTHFQFEEQHMKESRYPLWEEHVDLHSQLITQMNTVVSKGFHTPESIDAFKKFMFHWLVDHIMEEDKKYSNFTKEKKR